MFLVSKKLILFNQLQSNEGVLVFTSV